MQDLIESKYGLPTRQEGRTILYCNFGYLKEKDQPQEQRLAEAIVGNVCRVLQMYGVPIDPAHTVQQALEPSVGRVIDVTWPARRAFNVDRGVGLGMDLVANSYFVGDVVPGLSSLPKIVDSGTLELETIVRLARD